MNYCVDRREQLPALYYERRLQEAPIPNTAAAAENSVLENAAMEPYNQENNDEQEVLIPHDHLNPIVLLERTVLLNETFEVTTYEMDEPALNHMENVEIASSENLFDDSLIANPLCDMNDEENPLIKYEIMLQQNDLDEVNAILNDDSIYEPRQFENEIGGSPYNGSEPDPGNRTKFDAAVTSIRMDSKVGLISSCCHHSERESGSAMTDRFVIN